MSVLRRLWFVPIAAWLVMSALAVPTQAQVTRLAIPATTLAPAIVPADLRLDVLNVLPHDTLGFITAHHLLDTKTTVENVLRKLTIPFDAGDDYAEFEAFLARLKGWDSQATHAFAFLPVAGQDNPEFAVFVPVKNYKEFAASLGATPTGDAPTEFNVEDGPKGWIAPKENYAVLTEPGDDGRTLLEGIVASKKSLTESRGPLRKWIAEYQVAAIITRGGSDKIIDAILDGLAEAKEQFKNNDDSDLAASAGQVVAVFDVYEAILKKLRDDVTHLAFGGMLNETTGLRLAGEALFVPNGKFAETVKDFAALPADPLAGQPNDRFFMAGAATLPTSLAEQLMTFSFGMYKNLPKDGGGAVFTEEQLKKLTQAAEDSMQGVKRFSLTMSAAGEGMLGGVVGLYHVDDSAEFMKRYEKSMAAVSELMQTTKSPALPMQKLERLKIDDLDVISVSVDMSKQFEQMGPQPAEVKQIMQAMFGGTTFTGYLTAAGKDQVVIAYDQKALVKAVADLKAGKPSLSEQPGLRKTAAMLPQNLHAVGYLDFGGAIEFGKKVAFAAMAAQGQGAFPIPIPPFPETAPLGFSARVNGSALEGQFVVPMDLMEGVRDYVQQVTQMFGGGLR